MKIFYLLVIIVFLKSCITPPARPYNAAEQVRNLAAFDLKCDEKERPVVRNIGALDYTARACGKQAKYKCSEVNQGFMNQLITGEKFDCQQVAGSEGEI